MSRPTDGPDEQAPQWQLLVNLRVAALRLRLERYQETVQRMGLFWRRYAGWIQVSQSCGIPLAICAVTLLIHMPTIDVLVLNIDESQYMASAAYYDSTGASAFTSKTGLNYTLWLYQSVARWFGAYRMEPIRCLAMFAYGTIATLIYFAAKLQTSTWCGLIAAAIYLSMHVHFEGLSANREVPASLLLVMGYLCFLTAHREKTQRPLRWAFLACVLSATAVLFKKQSAVICLALPTYLIYRTLCDGWSRRALRMLAVMALAGLCVAALYFLPFLLAGSAADHMAYIRQMSQYAGNHASGFDGPALTHHLGMLLLPNPPFQPVGIICFVYGLGILLWMLWTLAKEPAPDEPRTLKSHAEMTVLYVIAAALAVSTGDRYFQHYYLLLLPFMSLLVACAVHDLGAFVSNRPVGWIAAAAGFSSFFFLDRRYWTIPISLALVAGGLVLLDELAPRSRRFWRLRFCLSVCVVLPWVWFCLDKTYLAAQYSQLLSASTRGGAVQGAEVDDLTRFLSEHTSGGERLFVWGWRPEIYCRTGLAPASSFTICAYVANDVVQNAADDQSPHQENLGALLGELKQHKPRFFVDAARISVTNSERRIYDLSRYPELQDYLGKHFQHIANLSDCAVFERLADHP